MSRSYRRHALVVCSKAWDNFKERAFRRRMKAACHQIEQEIEFDPDRDWEEAYLNHKKMGEYGTKFGVMGWDLNPDDTGLFGYEWARKVIRK